MGLYALMLGVHVLQKHSTGASLANVSSGTRVAVDPSAVVPRMWCDVSAVLLRLVHYGDAVLLPALQGPGQHPIQSIHGVSWTTPSQCTMVDVLVLLQVWDPMASGG